jgi:hypothetical protein
MDSPKSYSICCTPEPADYSLLTPEEKKRFGLLVNQLRKQGMSLELAQECAYSRVMCEEIPFV